MRNGNKYLDKQGNLHIMCMDGMCEKIIPNFKKAKNMISPVICLRCGEIYDLCDGEVIHRYADCTLYKTPCCNQTVDDRTWTGSPAFRRLTEEELSLVC